MKFAIYPYKTGSQSAKALAEALESKQIKHEGSTFNKWNDPKWWVINWGSTQCPSGASVLNSALNIGVASNKLSYLNLIKDHARVPEFTTNKEHAKTWFSNSKYVVCRTTLNGHSGNGIVLVDSVDSVTDAPLYTRYTPKDAEYRLHFAFNHQAPFFIQKKVRKKDVEDHDNQIRNLKGGWVYAHNDIDVPGDVLLQGREAFGHSNLDFGCIDIIYRKSTDKAYVLECNTAAGLQGTTINKYRDVFLGLNT